MTSILALGIQYLQGITNHIDFSGRADATFVDYKFRNRMQSGKESLLVRGRCRAEFQIVSRQVHRGALPARRYWRIYV